MMDEISWYFYSEPLKNINTFAHSVIFNIAMVQVVEILFEPWGYPSNMNGNMILQC